jgi:hypothetical protein
MLEVGAAGGVGRGLCRCRSLHLIREVMLVYLCFVNRFDNFCWHSALNADGSRTYRAED